MKKNLSILFVLLLFGCNPYAEEAVTITKDYVINPNWDKQSNRFDVNEMQLKEGLEKISPSSATSFDLLQNLIKNMESSYGANVNYNSIEYSERKVYFDRDNGFTWIKLNDLHSDARQSTIGNLKPETWYLLGGLSKVNTLYYIYIDASGKLHTVRVPASDWTNI